MMLKTLLHQPHLLKSLSSFLGVLAISSLIALPVFSQSDSGGSNSNVSIDLNTGSTTVIISPDGKQVMTPVGTVTSEAGFTATPDGAYIAQDGTTINRDGSIITPNGVTILPNGEILRPGQNNIPKQEGEQGGQGEKGLNKIVVRSPHLSM